VNKVSAKKDYHHGDARAALLRAASEMIEDTGAAALSLRAVAERANLSRQAPYNHFADKAAMLAAIVTRGFERLAAEVSAGAQGMAGTTALAAAGEAYIGFAQRAPALFRLMYARELVDIADFPDAASAANDAYTALKKVVATMDVGGRNPNDVSLAAWCLVHGYATLCNEAGIEGSDQKASRAAMFAAIIAG